MSCAGNQLVICYNYLFCMGGHALVKPNLFPHMPKLMLCKRHYYIYIFSYNNYYLLCFYKTILY